MLPGAGITRKLSEPLAAGSSESAKGKENSSSDEGDAEDAGDSDDVVAPVSKCAASGNPNQSSGGNAMPQALPATSSSSAT